MPPLFLPRQTSFQRWVFVFGLTNEQEPEQEGSVGGGWERESGWVELHMCVLVCSQREEGPDYTERIMQS